MSLSDMDIKYHNARINLYVRIPDGVYVPEDFQFSEEDMRKAEEDFGIHSTSMCRALEVNDYIISILEDMGVKVYGSAVSDPYEVHSR